MCLRRTVWSGQFDRPVDLALDAGGNLYVVDFGNDRIPVWAPVGAQQPLEADSPRKQVR